MRTNLKARIFAIASALLCFGGPVRADGNSVELDCHYHLNAGKFSADHTVRIGVDYVHGLVRVYPEADGMSMSAPPSGIDYGTAYIEGDHLVNHATITDETITWSNSSVVGSALVPATNWVVAVTIDRKTGEFGLSWNPQGGVNSLPGTCTKRSDTNKF